MSSMSPHLCFQSKGGAGEFRHPLVFGALVEPQLLQLSLRLPQLLRQIFSMLSLLVQVLLIKIKQQGSELCFFMQHACGAVGQITLSEHTTKEQLSVINYCTLF